MMTSRKPSAKTKARPITLPTRVTVVIFGDEYHERGLNIGKGDIHECPVAVSLGRPYPPLLVLEQH
jgi:hypothetical protein